MVPWSSLFCHFSCLVNNFFNLTILCMEFSLFLYGCLYSLWLCLLTAAAAAELLQSCPTLCDTTDSSPPGSSIPGIFQARILEWVAISFSNACMHAKSLQSCPTLCDPTDSSPPGSSIPGILQARTLEWVAISFSNAWKWKVNVKSLSRVWLLATPWTAAYQLLRPWDFPGKSTGCHRLLH